MRKLVRTLLMVLVANGSLAVHAQAPSSSAITNDNKITPLDAEVIERSVERWVREAPAQPEERAIVKKQKRMGTGTRALIIAGSAVGGFFAGGIVGHWIENRYAPCGCDDPGLKGVLIGAPIGAIAGGAVAAIVTR